MRPPILKGYETQETSDETVVYIYTNATNFPQISP
jgi:hypothetical protein